MASKQSIPELMQKYLAKCVGRDMMLKTIVYTLRLMTLYHRPGDKEHQKRLQSIILSIIDCRMLSNHWKYIPTFRQCIQTVNQRDKLPFDAWILTVASFFFRTWEQFAGDISYMQKNVFNEWSRKRISWHYKFNKSVSLTCCLLIELLKIRSLKKRILMQDNIESPAATPSFQAAGMFPKGDSFEDTVELKNQMRRSFMFAFRNICDMIVYFQWIESYKPYKTLEYTCGLCSGAIGVYLVWADLTAPPCPNKKEV